MTVLVVEIDLDDRFRAARMSAQGRVRAQNCTSVMAAALRSADAEKLQATGLTRPTAARPRSH